MEVAKSPYYEQCGEQQGVQNLVLLMCLRACLILQTTEALIGNVSISTAV